MAKKLTLALIATAALGAVTFVGAGPSTAQEPLATQCAPAAGFAAATTPVAFWSTEARCAIVPPTAGPENFGSKFPGEAAVYMGIVHVAIYDAAVATEGGYRPFLPTPRAPARTSPAAAIAAATHDTLIRLQPALGLTAGQQAVLDGDYAAYLAAIPDGRAKTNGLAAGQQVAATVIAWRANDGRDNNPTLADLNPPTPAPGVWQPDRARPVLGLRLPGIRPLALISASQFRPDGPPALTGQLYAHDLNQVEQLGAIDSSTRTPAQTEQALFWTDHDLRVWNDGLLRLSAQRGLGLVQTARMLAMAHVTGGDAMIACFDAKYHYWFWRPYQAIPGADADNNPDTTADPHLAAAGDDAELPRIPLGARLPQHRHRHRPRCLLRHRQRSDDARQPRHRHNPPLQPPARHRQRRRLGTRPRRLSFPKLRPPGQRARTERRTLRHRALLPANGVVKHSAREAPPTAASRRRSAARRLQRHDRAYRNRHTANRSRLTAAPPRTRARDSGRQWLPERTTRERDEPATGCARRFCRSQRSMSRPGTRDPDRARKSSAALLLDDLASHQVEPRLTAQRDPCRTKGAAAATTARVAG
jgi:hypothetical protein